MATLATSPFSQKAESEISTVDSSFLENFTYDAKTLQLSVTMKSGSQYLYFFVTPMVIEQLMKSPSKGKFYSEMIKGKFQGQSVVHKTIGPQNRNPLKGPSHDKSRITKQPVHYRA